MMMMSSHALLTSVVPSYIGSGVLAMVAKPDHFMQQSYDIALIVDHVWMQWLGHTHSIMKVEPPASVVSLVATFCILGGSLLTSSLHNSWWVDL